MNSQMMKLLLTLITTLFSPKKSIQIVQRNELTLETILFLKKKNYFVKFYIKGEYDGKVVCLDIGLKLNFRCKYQLGEKLVSSQVDVSGHDDSFDAEGTGKITIQC